MSVSVSVIWFKVFLTSGSVGSMYRMPADGRESMGRQARAYFEREFCADKLVDTLEQWMREAAEEGLCES